MVIVPVSQLKTGERLNEDVLTPLGSVLFQKGKIIHKKEVEILQAFLVKAVSIEQDPSQKDEKSEELLKDAESQKELMHFFKEYDAMFHLLKRTFNLAYSGGQIPILEIRKTMEALISLIEFYNILSFRPRNVQLKDYVYHNSILTALTGYTLAKWLGLPQKDLIPIALSGLFHDIGNVKVDPVVLEKPTRLTSMEQEEMRKHTIYGYNILKNVPAINEGVKLCALQHHEREDGSGYPLALKSEKIHPYAKIIAIGDIFHAMTSNRQYKQATSAYLVLEQLSKESFGKLDPGMVQTFINRATQFHTGMLVKLNDNRIGEIVFSDRTNPTRPMVNINGTIVNLATERNLFIRDIIRY